MSLRVMSGAVALGVAGALAVPMVSQAAAPAASGPKVHLVPHAHYATGYSVDTDWESEGGSTFLEEWYAHFAISWTASAPSGICGQTLTYRDYDTLGGDPDPVLGSDTDTITLAPGQRTYSFAVDGMDWWRVPNEFVVRVTDCTGHTATSGIADTRFGVLEDTSTALSYTGTWATSSFSGFSGGTTHETSLAGAAAAATVDGGATALVMEKAANRGKVDVYVDGVRKATVNTLSSTTLHRQVVWQAMLKPGTHVVKVVNKATAGHPRIDLDAVLNPAGAY